MKIERGELVDSERVEEGDDEFDVENVVVGDFIKSRFNLYALPLKHEDILSAEAQSRACLGVGKCQSLGNQGKQFWKGMFEGKTPKPWQRQSTKMCSEILNSSLE